MVIRPFAMLATAAVLSGAMSTAQALSINLNVLGDTTVTPGSTVDIEVSIDFSDEPTLGGGVDLFWDAGAVANAQWISTGLGDPALNFDPVIGPGEALGAAVGDFGGLITGVMGTLSLTLAADAAPGTYTVSSAENMGGGTGFGPWISRLTFAAYPPGAIEFGSASFTVVPLPAAVWFLLSGLTVVAGVRRRTP